MTGAGRGWGLSALVGMAAALALRRAGVPAEMHLYEKGPHGFGTAAGLGPTSEWPKRLEEWLRSHGWLDAPAP